MKRFSLFLLALIAFAPMAWAELVQDAEGYYLIGTDAEWTEFANGINDGTIAINANARLTAENITVTTMIGNNGHRYAGTFDGDNKTITLSISGTSGFEAPFSYINGATIKDLTVSGTLSGGIHCSGLIGVTTGTNNVNNVIVNCTITATGSHCSGLLGRHDAGTTTLNGCAFTGSISKASGSCNVGVLWGWSNGGNAIITNCLENGTYTNCSPLQPIGNLPTNNVTNTFYLSNVSSTCGTRIYTTTQDGEVNGQVVAVDGNNYYATSAVSGINERYELLEASVTPEPIVSFLGVTLTKDTDYTVSYSNNNSGGTGSVIITGINDFTGTKTVNFAIAANTLSGNGTEESPYIIGSDADWEAFAASVNSGFTYSGRFVKLDANNINASTPVGLRDAETFSGTFNGNNNTLILNIVSTETSSTYLGVAPFHYIKNATIMNVKTTGSVTSASIHTSGLVGRADGTNLIQNCTVSATINTSNSYVGGIIGHGFTSITTLEGCIFNGTVHGNNSAYVVGLYGWSHGGTGSVRNCLENGTYTSCSSFNPVRQGYGNFNVSDTYYLNPLTIAGDYGTRVYTTIPEGEMCGQVTAVDNNNYYVVTTVSGINERYQLMGESVAPVPVVKFFNTTLTQNTDYTVSYSNNTSGGTGSVIITGINDYTGTKTVNFEIAANTLSGSGTEGNPYIINSDEDWTSFANSVNSGFTYSGMFLKLTNNVNATVNIGLRSNEPFSGTFDGDGHTLTVTLTANAASTSGNTEGIAPFHFIKNATIKNLRTAGTITSTTNHTSGLVGFSEGTNAIQNCVVSTTLNVRNYAGGIVGHSQASRVTIDDCLFDGIINGSSSSYIAGIWGWNNGGSGTIANCLENGTYTGVSSYDAMGWTPATLTNTYRINSSSKGIATTAEAVADGSITYKLQAGRANLVWGQRIGIDPEPVLTNDENYRVYRSINGGYTNDLTQAYEGLQQDTDDNYLIGSVWDWQEFAALVNGGTTNINARMTADIDLGDDQTMIGATGANATFPCFQGTFDGHGHTLTVAYTGIGNESVGAPFAKINGATIKNLHVAGTINSGGYHPSVVSDSWGTSTVENVWSSLTIISTRSGWVECGSIVGCMKAGNLTIKDCLFTGSISASGGYNGCFVGYNVGTTTMTNCLSLGTFSYPNGYNSWTSVPAGTHTNCFVKQFQNNDIPTAMQITDEQLADGTVAYKLQASRTDMVWGQRIGTDPEPVLTNDENYRVYRSINGGYTNDPTLAYEGLQQDADDNYLIGSVWAWQDFAALVNGGTTTANAKMTADIDLGDDQTHIGPLEQQNTNTQSYSGTFDGQGHTLTVAYTGSGQQIVAPFTHVSGATIKNLHVDGTIQSTFAFNGLVGLATGTGNLTISNVWLSADISSTQSGWSWCGAFIGCIWGSVSVSITDCLFTGSLTCNNGTANNGCFVFNYTGSATITNCLSTGTFSYGDGVAFTGTHTKCYVKQFPATFPVGVTQTTESTLADGTITAALQADRTEEIWVQDIVTHQPMLKLFATTSISLVTAGNWNVGSNWNINAVPAAGADVTIAAAATIPSGYTADAGNITIADGGSLTIADGGGLIHSNEGITATVEKNIEAWTTGTPVGGWYFIASPISTTLEPNNVTNLLTEPVGVNYTYDLYRYDHSETLPWQNYHQHMADFHMANGQGFLYANAAAQTLEFSGTLKPYSTESNANQVTLAQDGWNLIGNPFSCPVIVSTAFAELNNGSTVTNKDANCVILSCRGIAVYGNAGEEVTFTAVTPVGSAALDNNNLQIALTQANTRGNSQIDNAIVSFNQGSTLPKFRFGDNAEIYISQGNEDYAIVSVDSYGELPLNFKAKENGTYSLSVNPEGVEMNYLHLIDNLTGADIDLMATSDYTFNAKTTDYASRFRLVFSANDENGASAGLAAFAFVDASGNIIITDDSADATLQIVDVMGRVIVSRSGHIQSVPTSGMPAGVYVLRLIDGNDVKTQKIVVE